MAGGRAAGRRGSLGPAALLLLSDWTRKHPVQSRLSHSGVAAVRGLPQNPHLGLPFPRHFLLNLVLCSAHNLFACLAFPSFQPVPTVNTPLGRQIQGGSTGTPAWPQ